MDGIWEWAKRAEEVEERQKAGTENMYRGARTIAQRLPRGLASEDGRSGEWPETGAKFEFSLVYKITRPLLYQFRQSRREKKRGKDRISLVFRCTRM